AARRAARRPRRDARLRLIARRARGQRSCGGALRPARLRSLDALPGPRRGVLRRAALLGRARAPPRAPGHRRALPRARPVLGRDAWRRARDPAPRRAALPHHLELARLDGAVDERGGTTPP